MISDHLTGFVGFIALEALKDSGLTFAMFYNVMDVFGHLISVDKIAAGKYLFFMAMFHVITDEKVCIFS